MAYPIASPIPSARPPETPRQEGGARGFRVDASDLASAQRAAIIPERGFIVQAGAAGAIGQAAQDISHGASQLMQEQFASTNRRKVMEADDMIQLAQDDFARRAEEETDSSKLYGMAQEEVAKWEKELLGDKTLSIDARQAIESKFNRWKLLMLGDDKAPGSVQVYAAKREFQREAEGLEGARIDAMRNNDWPEVERLTAEKEKRGLIGKDVAAKERFQTEKAKEAAEATAKAKVYDIHHNTVTAVVPTQSPEETRKMVNDPEFAKDLSPDERKSLVDHAESLVRDQSAAVAQDIGNRIAGGTVKAVEGAGGAPGGPIKSAAHVDAITSPFFTPKMRADTIHFLNNYNAQEASVKRNGPEGHKEFIKAYIDARKWKPDPTKPEEAADQQYQKILNVTSNVPDRLQGDITAILHNKFQAYGRVGNTRPEIQTAVTNSLTASFDRMLMPFDQARDAAKTVYNSYDPDKPGNSYAYKEALKAVWDSTEKAYNTKQDEIFRAAGEAQAKMSEFFEMPRPNPKPGDQDVWDAKNKALREEAIVAGLEQLLDVAAAPVVEAAEAAAATQAAIDAESARKAKGKTYQQKRREPVSSATDAKPGEPPMPVDGDILRDEPEPPGPSGAGFPGPPEGQVKIRFITEQDIAGVETALLVFDGKDWVWVDKGSLDPNKHAVQDQ